MQGSRLLQLLLGPACCTLAAMAFCASAGAQAPGPPPAPATPAAPDQPPKSLGNYSLVVTTQEPSATTHLLNPPLDVDVEAATELAPKDASGTKSIPPQYVIDGFANPRYDCIPAPAPAAIPAPAPASAAAAAAIPLPTAVPPPAPVLAKDHPCEAIDRTELTIRDANTVGYHIANHGPAAQLQLNLQVHDLEPVSRAALDGSWHAAEVIFVAVPKSTPALKVLSATLIGDWDGNAIVFEPGKPLPETAKKGLEDLNIHQDLGDKTLYSYKVKDPKPAK